MIRRQAGAASAQQAGTLSGNPLAMTAGLKTLEILGRPGQYEYLDKITGRLIKGILDAGREYGHAVEGGHISGERFDARPWTLGKANREQAQGIYVSNRALLQGVTCTICICKLAAR